MLGKFLWRLAALAVASAALGLSLSAQAETFPSRPIKIVVPYAPGGLPDTVARLLADRLGQPLGQPVVVENRPGASGMVATATIMQAPPDGYTLMLTDGPLLAIGPYITRKFGYSMMKDFTPVALVGKAPLFLAVNAGVKANTLDELIALAKAKPGELNYGSSGLGSIHQLTAEAMKVDLGLDIAHIPFKGSGASMPALIGGQVDMLFASPPALMGFVKSKQAKLIAINAASRSDLAPDVPALAERIPGFDFAFTVVVLAKAGTPPEVVERLSQEITKAVRLPNMVEPLRVAGVDPAPGGPKELAAAMKAESERITKAAQIAGLKPE
ncbi:MAG: tripartite tricarboxylate transporter substrate binding protein [Burkholderiaceae bacterium]|jgi:tripartite-type tricarboxylate transporter receptor subunit TctC|nr:tripartite tricarboxylate transporter substrate binding protein [Burkholderiaceae bacterium]